MRNRIQIVSALLIVASVAVALFTALSYLRERDYLRLVYARVIESQDIVDTARNALAALEQAEIHGQSYVLTGQAAYSKAYAGDASEWQDEIGTLAVLAANDKALSPVKDLTSTGDRALKELGAVISLYDGGSRDKALESFRNGSGVVALDQARSIAGKILTAAHDKLSSDAKRIPNGIRRRFVLASAAALFCLALIGAVLLLFETRRAAKLRSGIPAGSLPDRA